MKVDARQLRQLDEAYLEQQVLGTAREYGWRAFHVRDSRKVLMGDAGFPDWVFAKGGRVLFVELKTERGTQSADQKAWAEQLPPDIYHLWRPTQWADGTVKRIFQGSES
jgi:hypothetical protein